MGKCSEKRSNQTKENNFLGNNIYIRSIYQDYLTIILQPKILLKLSHKTEKGHNSYLLRGDLLLINNSLLLKKLRKRLNSRRS